MSNRGAARWARGHPWIYRSDVTMAPEESGVVAVDDPSGRCIGIALYSAQSEIRLRRLGDDNGPLDSDWWVRAIDAANRRRVGIDSNAYRVVHGEGDGLPSLIVDRYDRWLVVQLLSAGLETLRPQIIEGLRSVLAPEGILLRHDVAVREREGLAQTVELAHGSVPETIEVVEGSVRFLAAPWTGQKTGAFLDQREARLYAGALAAERGRALDCFAYHGSFALHLAQKSASVLALDRSGEALERGRANAALNRLGNIEWREADAFAALRELERAGARYDTIVLDPPAFAKSRRSVGNALRGYQEINLRAMRLLVPGGVLLTASCSHHIGRPEFLQMLETAAADSGRDIRLTAILAQPVDHPELLTVPETGYLKTVVLTAL